MRRWRSRPRPANRQINDLAAGAGPERTDEADAGWIFTGVYGDPKATSQDKAEDNAPWKKLGAVRNGQAKDVLDETWYLGLGGPPPARSSTASTCT